MLKFQQEESPLINDEKRAELMQETSGAEASEQADDFLTVASREQTVRRGTIILTAIFLAGFAALFLMIRKSTPGEASAGESAQTKTLEAAVAQITGIKRELAGDLPAALIDELSSVDRMQIKVDDLKKNPFMFDKVLGGNVMAAEETEAFSVEARTLVQQRMELHVNGLRLMGIMQSPTGNSCMINEKILHVGDTIEGFQILAINNDSVELSSQGISLILRIAAGR